MYIYNNVAVMHMQFYPHECVFWKNGLVHGTIDHERCPDAYACMKPYSIHEGGLQYASIIF